MNQRIIYQTEEGGVAIIVPTPEALQTMTIEEIAAKDVPDGKPYEIINIEDVPSDRTFRNAWEKSGKTIQHNMDKAKNIAHDKRRAARAAEFAPLDIESTIPAKAQQAEAKRQAIRDKYAAMQTQMDSAKNVEELKALLPKD